MFDLYLTPDSISGLSQFIMTLIVTGYLLSRLRTQQARPPHLLILTGFFVCLTLLALSLFWGASLLPSDQLFVVFVQNVLLGAGLVLLLQFAYRFPAPLGHSSERRLVLGLSSLYVLYEAAYALYRFWLLLEHGQVFFRPAWADYWPLLEMAWTLALFARQLRALARAKKQAEAHLARALGTVMVLPLGLSLLVLLKTFHLIPASVYRLGISAGLLIVPTAFIAVYLNYLPGVTSFMVKLSGLTLATLLTTLGIVGWAIEPTWTAHYKPSLPDYQTLRFTPNTRGGYDIAVVPFYFETEPGVNLNLSDNPAVTGKPSSARLDFDFVFYGQRYTQLYVTHDGTIALGRDVSYRDYLYHYGSAPLIFALLVDLIPDAGGGIFAHQTADRLTITWAHIPAFAQRAAVYTFQVNLYRSGIFEITYNGLPASLEYRASYEPWANVWLIGSMPGPNPEQSWSWPAIGSIPSDGILVGGAAGLVNDYYLGLRRYLHELLWPVAILIPTVSVLVVMGFPYLFYINLIRPLDALMAGARQMDSGHLNTRLTPQFPDEIGFLTETFNTMCAALNDLVTNLEERVIERTQALAEANEQLRCEIAERERAQAQVVQQQREMAALTERERIGRELHDDLGQVLGYISAQAAAAREWLAAGQTPQTQASLESLADVAAQAHRDIREYIAGVRLFALLEQGLVAALEHYTARFSQLYDLPVELVALPLPKEQIPPAVKIQTLRIIQEALTNARKHARASRVGVTLTLEADAAGPVLQVIVQDDGVGFVEEQQREGHFGLDIMRERAHEIGGNLQIASAPGQGTRIILRVPLANVFLL